MKTKFKQTEIGMIPEDWEIKLISHVVNIISGGTPKTSNPDYWGGNIPWISIVDFVGDNRWIHKTEKTITKMGLDESSTGLLHKGQLIISARGTVGEIGQVTRDMTFNQSCYGLDGKNGLLNDFLYYLLKYKIRDIQSKTHGSVFNTITRNTFDQILVQIPEETEQLSISKILSDLDSKIELNQQMNKALEEIGRALFKHWFVDFEFPNEEGKPYKSSGGEVVHNEELGKEIPKKWEVKGFSEVIEVNPKRELPKGRTAKKVSMSDLNPWQSWIENWTLEEYKSGTRFGNGDTLFARITPSLENGKTAFVTMLDDNEMGFGSTEFIVFSKKVISSNFYIFHLCRTEEIRNAAISAMTGTSGRQRVPDDLFDYLLVTLPPSNLIEKFEKLCSSLFNQISNNAKEIKTLS